MRELLGMIVAFAGVAAIVLRGDLAALTHMRFNIGDFGMLSAAIALASIRSFCAVQPRKRCRH